MSDLLIGDDTVTGGSGDGTGLDWTGVGDDTVTTGGGGNGVGLDWTGVNETSNTSGTGGSFDFSKLNLKDVSDYLQGNRGLFSLIGGAGLAAMGAGTPTTKSSIYQGGIPNLVATRNMITAPPTGRRAGAGGVNYGGDVTYSLAPAGQKPYSLTRGDSAFITDPQGQANVLKGTGGADTQSMANKIGYNLPGGWDSFTPQQKIEWFNRNNVSYDQLRAAGVPQSDIDYMWSNGYASGRPADWGKTTPVTGGAGTVTGGASTVTGGAGIDTLVDSQNKAQTQADKVGLQLPSDWSTYNAAQKIAWYNTNNVTEAQLLAAGVDQATIDWMKQNGYGSSNKTSVDTVTGGTGLDTVSSGTGSDSVTGGAGSDSITGGTGADTTSGGTGIDALVAAQTKAQTQADTINLKLPSDWSTYDAAKKIAWYNSNNVTPSALLAAGVDQGTLDWMKQNGYNGGLTGSETISDTNYPLARDTEGYGIDNLVAAQETAQAKADKIGLTLPSDWSSYDMAKKINWFNQQGILPEQLRDAGISEAEIGFMRENGYGLQGGTEAQTKSAGLMSAIEQGMSQDQYIGNIKDWLTKNSTASDAEVYKQMQQYGIGAEDVAAALGVPVETIQGKIANLLRPSENYGYRDGYSGPPPEVSKSAGLQSALDQGMSQDQYIGNIKNWLTQNSTASDADVYKQMQEYGIGAEDVALALGVPVDVIQGKINALQQPSDIRPSPAVMPEGADYTPKQVTRPEDVLASMEKTFQQQTEPVAPSPDSEQYRMSNRSAGLQSALEQGMSEDQYIGNIKNWLTQNSTASDAEVFQQMQEYGIGAEDVARALGVPISVIQSKIDALGGNNYAQGGMAQGRYLQGGTDGMADEIPAQIGRDQPAALSHGEFVIPADVVSHMGNGNSDAGAKKLYEMMDRIRMARTGTKEQGRKINPDKFMPGGLAQAYAGGGSVKNFATGGTTTMPVNVTGQQAGLSSWAGDYTTDLMGQGRALANMPYQAYMGPLTAGPSALQNKVTQGLESLDFPGTLGKSFTSAGAPTIGADGQPVGGGGIASSYMNPYLKNVLDPQLEELRRQSQINLQPGLAKLTSAGGFGGGRQAIMESEAGRNLLNAQNTAIGQGYANAYDKAMQQFNTEQGQAKTLADMMASQGATERAIEAEGVAADKAQFEEARANPFKMVQFQQSLLSGMPINASDYTIQDPSNLAKVAQGVSTVDQLLKVLYGIDPAKKVAGT